MAVSSRQQRAATARVILICHGSTEAVRAAKFPSDEPLDDPDLKTIKTLADALPQASQCWTGPERRTRQTAQALGLNAQIEPLLRDCDYGAWAGRTFDDVHAHEPDAASAWLRDPAAAPHGGETIAAVIHRVGQWLAGERAGGSTRGRCHSPHDYPRCDRSCHQGRAAIFLAHRHRAAVGHPTEQPGRPMESLGGRLHGNKEAELERL